MRKKGNKTCYMCSAQETTTEHVPPDSFFPEGFRQNLLTVPSCDEHNTKNSMDVEYVRNVLCQHADNDAARRAFATAKRSYEQSPALFTRTFAQIRKVTIEGHETGAYPIDLKRLEKVMKSVAHGLFYRDYGKPHDGDFTMFPSSLAYPDAFYRGNTDPWARFRAYLKSGNFVSKSTSNPSVFKYGVLEIGEGQIFYRLTFYETFEVHLWSNPTKLSPVLFLPRGGYWVRGEK